MGSWLNKLGYFGPSQAPLLLGTTCYTQVMAAQRGLDMGRAAGLKQGINIFLMLEANFLCIFLDQQFSICGL